MTALKSNNKFAINYFTRLKANKKYMAIIFIMHMLAAPLFLIMAIININKLNTANYLGQYVDWDGSLVIYIIIAVITTAIAVFCGISIAINNFNYLHKKSNVDMVYALPITNDHRFFSDYLSGLTTYIAPFLASGIFTFILSFFTQSAIKNSSFYKEYTSDYFMSVPEIAIKLILFGTILMIVLYTLCVFTSTFSGNLIFAVGNVVALNIIIPLTIVLSAGVFYNNHYGLENSYGFLSILYGTSPAGGLGYVLNYFTGENLLGVYPYNLNTNYLTAFILPFLAVSIAMFIGAYFLNKNRKAEDVSKAYPYKTFYYVIMAFLTFIVASIFALSDDITKMIFPAIVVLAVVWLIISVILNKGFKHIAKTGIQFAITTGIILTLLVTNYKTDGFGVAYRQPDLNDIKSISTNYSGIFSNFSIIWSNENNIVATIDDEKYIKLFYETHKDILDEYEETKDEYRDNYYRNTHFNITYNLKNGKIMTRSYYVENNQLEKLSPLDLTDEYIDQVIDYQIEKYEEGQVKMSNIQFVCCDSVIRLPLSTLSEFGIDINEAKSFFEAARKDLKSLSPEDYYSPSQKPICRLSINGFEIVVNENYKNVLKWLSNHMDINKVEYTELQLSQFYSEKSILKIKALDSNILISTYGNRYNEQNTQRYAELTDEEKDDMLTLMQYAQPYYYSASDVYVISYNGEMYAIPQQFNDIAEIYSTEIIEEYYNK